MNQQKNQLKFMMMLLTMFLFIVSYQPLLNSNSHVVQPSIQLAQQEHPDYNYGEVLQKSIYFYEAQRSGKLPKNQRVEWRGDSALNDGADHNIDLTGGWYDAGDHIKFGFPMAAATTMLAWGVIEYEDAYKNAGQYDFILDNLRWVNDYFIKAHPAPNILWVQVGKPSLDHYWWGPAEVMPMARPAYQVDQTCPGSDVAAETAAALSASAMVFKKVDINYANQLLKHAQQLYEFADKYRGKYSDCLADVNDKNSYISWSGYQDELVWGAVWLYYATQNPQYLQKAEQYYYQLQQEPEGVNVYKWTQDWDNKFYGSYVLLAKLTGKQQYRQDAERWLDYWTDGYHGERINYTPGGLAWLGKWGSLRHAANTSFLSFIYADWIEDANKKERYSQFAENQINYILGSNPQHRSYVIGFGQNYPQNPHHRTAHGSWNNDITTPEKSRHILYGALVGGPDQNDSYQDNRKNFVQTEVAVDYNAAFTGAIAKLYSKYGGKPLSDFPQPEEKDQEFYITANIQSEGKDFTAVQATIYNQSAWPARIIQPLSFRYFMNLSEFNAINNQRTNIKVNFKSNAHVSVSPVQPWNLSKDLYYIQFNLDGSQLKPGDPNTYKTSINFRLTSPIDSWNPDNDWSYASLNQPNQSNSQITVYNNEKLIFGQEPS
jgi:endoglucanase